MKFQYIGKKTNTNAYNIHAGLNPGDVISLTGQMARKAKQNPDFKEAPNAKKVTITPEESERIWEENKATPPEYNELAKLKAKMRDIEEKLTLRTLEPESDIDAVFNDEE